MSFELELTSKFKQSYKKLTSKNPQLISKLNDCLRKLNENPFQKSLVTHKVHTSSFREVFSSRVTGDLRIIWIQIDKKHLLLLLDLGGHSGNKSVYS